MRVVLILKGHVKEVKSICWDTSGKYMASVSEESARVWSIVYGGKCVQELQSNGNKFESCIFHPGYSNVLVIGSNQVTKCSFRHYVCYVLFSDLYPSNRLTTKQMSLSISVCPKKKNRCCRYY